MYISEEKRIAGVCIAEPISSVRNFNVYTFNMYVLKKEMSFEDSESTFSFGHS